MCYGLCFVLRATARRGDTRKFRRYGLGYVDFNFKEAVAVESRKRRGEWGAQREDPGSQPSKTK